MFDYCSIKNKECGYCTHEDAKQYCGLATANNQIKNMPNCPYKPKKRK